jgi:two-component system response regulator RegX3
LFFHRIEQLTIERGRRGRASIDFPGETVAALCDQAPDYALLPGLDGLTLCERIRAVDCGQPIIMLTAKADDDDIIKGLQLGANDYVAKPFSVTELVLRIKAVLRRTPAAQTRAAIIRLGAQTEIDLHNMRVVRGTQATLLTRRELDVLEYVYLHRARPVSRTELLTKVWGYSRTSEIETRTVDIHSAKLRRKTALDPALPRMLITVRRAGYKLELEHA